MEEVKYKEMTKELLAIFEKYEAKNTAICGEADGMFFGGAVSMGDTFDILTAAQTFFNIGRLFQYAKENNRKILDCFEKIRS